MLTTEDWWAVWLGLIMFLAGFLTIWDINIVGWMAKTKTWVWGDFAWANALAASGKGAYKGMHPLASLLMTYVVFTVLTCIGAYFMKLDVKRFFVGFTIIFAITWGLWIIGHEAHFKASKTAESIGQPAIYGENLYCTTKVNKCSKELKKAFKKLGVEGQPNPAAVEQAVKKAKHVIPMSWGLQLGGGFSFMLALAVGLIIGNLFKPFANYLKEAAKPEWFIKTAIVYLGIKLGLLSMKAAGFAFELAMAGAAATFVAYMFFWPGIYWLGRRFFNLRRDSSAVVASGISICGVSASIATAGAIRAKPVLPIAVSMLIVIFAMFELIILPIFYTAVFPNQPIVNGAAMGMTVKTDGADAAAGAILEELMKARHYQATGEEWGAGILEAAIITKIWIDVFIGVWAFLLAMIWVYKVERKPGEAAVGASEIWFRFPKFVLGYFIAWFTYLAIAFWAPEVIKEASVGAKIVQSPMRKMMFMLTFVSIGVITDFSKLKGMGRLALLYGIGLFLFIAPVAYVVAWIFHRGMVPLPAGGG
ncbi:MAG: putative sulfate exporter family transporter [Acidiferrobacterales bacterium]